MPVAPRIATAAIQLPEEINPDNAPNAHRLSPGLISATNGANIKTTALTPTGKIHITITGESRYRLTHHTRPTQNVTGETELLAAIATTDDGGIAVRLLAKDNTIVVLTQDTRHGNIGWRGSRYLNIGKQTKVWDEWYLFFWTLAEAIELFGRKLEKTETGINDARCRF